MSFIGSAVNGSRRAEATVIYTDGSTDTIDLAFTDWTVGGGGGSVQYGNEVVARAAYRNVAGADRDPVATYVFATKPFAAPAGGRSEREAAGQRGPARVHPRGELNSPSQQGSPLPSRESASVGAPTGGGGSVCDSDDLPGGRVMRARGTVLRPAAVCLALVMPLGVLAGCGSGVGAAKKSWIAVPEQFYLRPPGDKSGPTNKVPFHVQAEDVKARSRVGTQDHRLTVDVTGSERAVRLKISDIRKKNPRCAGTTPGSSAR